MGENVCLWVIHSVCTLNVRQQCNELLVMSSVSNMLDAQWHTLRVVAQKSMTLYLQAVEARGVEYRWAGVLPRQPCRRARATRAGLFSPAL